MRIGPIRLFEREVIGPADAPYMRRLRIFECPWFRVYFHRILRSDVDRDFHDHPWNFVSLILKGAFLEWRPSSIEEINSIHEKPLSLERFNLDYRPPVRVAGYYGPLDILVRQARDLHRIELPQGVKSVWTLVIAGRRVREWGFLTPAGWVSWNRYPVEP